MEMTVRPLTNKNIFTDVCDYIQTTGRFDFANQ